MLRIDERHRKEADQLYERYVKPLEPKYSGYYAAVSAEGKVVLGKTLLDACQQATATLGPGNFVFKIGEKVVGRWR